MPVALATIVAHPPVERQGGWVLSELLVVVAILGLLGGLVGSTLVRQQRFYRGANELLHAREGVRDALAVLASDVRGLAPADTVRLLADSAMEFFAGIGASVVCTTDGAWTVGLPGTSSSAGSAFGAFNTEPDTGDLAYFYRDTTENGSRWERHRILSFSSSSFVPGCTLAMNAAAAMAGQPGYVLNLATPLSEHVRKGAPVRFARRGRYSLYRASDGDWFLGYRRCNALGPSCGSIQPVSGPYRPYSAVESATGLLFRYFDRGGQALAPGSSPLELARVDVTARAESHQKLREGSRTLAFGDSATISIAIRNE